MLTKYMMPDGTIVDIKDPNEFIEAKVGREDAELVQEIMQSGITPVFIGSVVNTKTGLKIG
jgi:hypothetical protein